MTEEENQSNEPKKSSVSNSEAKRRHAEYYKKKLVEGGLEPDDHAQVDRAFNRWKEEHPEPSISSINPGDPTNN